MGKDFSPVQESFPCMKTAQIEDSEHAQMMWCRYTEPKNSNDNNKADALTLIGSHALGVVSYVVPPFVLETVSRFSHFSFIANWKSGGPLGPNF